MSILRLRILLICCIVGLTPASSPAYAGLIAVSFSLPQSPTVLGLVNGVDGFDFTPSRDLLITALGWYDHNGDGLNREHPVGIFLTSSQTLTAPSAIVTTSSVLSDTGDFRFTMVNPFILTAGVTYTLVGYGEGPNFDPYVRNPSGGINFGPDVSFVRLRTSRSLGLEFPTVGGGIGLIQDLFIGPNFQYTTVSAVPEPTTAILLVIGILGISIHMSFFRRFGKAKLSVSA